MEGKKGERKNHQILKKTQKNKCAIIVFTMSLDKVGGVVRHVCEFLFFRGHTISDTQSKQMESNNTMNRAVHTYAF